MSERAGGRSDAPKPSYRFGAAGVVIDRLAKCLSHSKNKQVCIRYSVAVQTVAYDTRFTLTGVGTVPGCTRLYYNNL